LSPGFKAQTTSPGAEIPLKKVFFSKNSPFPLAPSSIAAKQRTEMAGVYFRGKKIVIPSCSSLFETGKMQS
jgi:hypothetical protein